MTPPAARPQLTGRVPDLSELPTDPRLVRAALCRYARPGDPAVHALLGAGRPQAALREALRCSGGPGAAGARWRVLDTDPAADLDTAARARVRFLVPGDDEWPDGVDDLPGPGWSPDPGQPGVGPPFGLYVLGPLRLPARADRAVAVVGSRAATAYGTWAASEIASDVAEAGHTVVSGGALGIDGAAHRGALAVGGPTLAVLAGGALDIYPRAHRALLQRLAAEGAVVSESPPDAVAVRHRFLSRNRLIAALAAGVVLVEAAVRSGALSTLRRAVDLNRVDMVVPGPVTSTASGGSNRWLQGSGALVTGGADVLELVGPLGAEPPAVRRGGAAKERSADARARDGIRGLALLVLDQVPARGPRPLEAVAAAASVHPHRALALLEHFREAGLVTVTDDGWTITRGAGNST